MSAAATLATPLVAASLLWSLKMLIDDVLIAGRLDVLPLFAALYVCILAAKLLLEFGTARLEAGLVEQIAQDVRTDLYKHLVALSPGSLRDSGIGDQLTRLSGDAERVEFLVYTGPLAVIADAAAASVFLVILLALNWKLTFCALTIAPLLVLISTRFAPKIRRAAKISRRAVAAWTSLAEERLGAAPLLQAFGTQEREAAAFAARCSAARQAEVRAVVLQARLTLLVESVAALGGLCVLVVAAFQIRNGALTIGTMVAFLASVGSLYAPVRGLAKASGRFQRAAAGAQRVADVFATQSLVVERPAATPLLRPRGALEFRRVRFGYTPERPAVEDISLRIEPGETVALVGASGSGKSTLVRLALRLHDPWSGAVLLDGHDVRDVTIASLRRTIAPVFQEPHIFRGSLADNIRYARPHADAAEVMRAAQAAHVSEFAGGLRGGIDSPVGPRGGWLSGGQCQRMALARALLCDAPILLLDEATSAVDSETEELIQDALERLAGRRTVVVVAHRLSSIRRADRVIVLEAGRVVESGTPRLLATKGTRCRDLFAAQLPEAAA